MFENYNYFIYFLEFLDVIDNYISVVWGPIIRGPIPFIHWGPRPRVEKGYSPGSLKQVQNNLGTQPRTIQSSACPRPHKKEGQKWYKNNLGKNLKYLRQ